MDVLDALSGSDASDSDSDADAVKAQGAEAGPSSKHEGKGATASHSEEEEDSPAKKPKKLESLTVADLERAGYKSGPSVLYVKPAQETGPSGWNWCVDSRGSVRGATACIGCGGLWAADQGFMLIGSILVPCKHHARAAAAGSCAAAGTHSGCRSMRVPAWSRPACPAGGQSRTPSHHAMPRLVLLYIKAAWWQKHVSTSTPEALLPAARADHHHFGNLSLNVCACTRRSNGQAAKQNEQDDDDEVRTWHESASASDPCMHPRGAAPAPCFMLHAAGCTSRQRRHLAPNTLHSVLEASASTGG